VDTFRGTRDGVPTLCNLLAAHSVTASFFFSVGPDNMGRHLWRLLRPAFFRKILRTRASNLYGWNIVFKGTFWPGPVIGEKLAHVIRAAADGGHEIGIHAWDHHAWQTHIDTMDGPAIRRDLGKGVALLEQIIGHTPTCSAAPGWKCNDLVLAEKNGFSFAYNSDCRGESIFRPVVGGEELPQPQIPVTLPTYDEAIGQDGVSNDNYNEYILSLLHPDKLNVLTIHAEVEGIACRTLFERFIGMARSTGASFVPLGALLEDSPPIVRATLAPRELPGREGWIACQTPVRLRNHTGEK
jgi:undecaprenyl phosphate-alpha-L-ara4FN deformylase